MRRLAGLLALALPACVVAAVLLLPAGWVALPLSAAAWVSFRQDRHGGWRRLITPVLLLALAVLCAFRREPDAAMFYPVVVNLALLSHFWQSLQGGPTAIERMARLSDPALPDRAVPYLRNLTKVWCGFFLLNAVVAMGTALHADPKVWALYNGLIAYVLVAALLVGERLLRPFLTKGAE